MTDSIALNTPADYRIYQRSGGTASVILAGTYVSAGGGAIEYRYKGGSWATLVASPSGGTFSQAATLTEGQGTLEVRLAANTGVTDSAVYIGVGEIFLIAGQSNAEGRLSLDQSYSHATLKAVVYDEAGTSWRDCIDPTDSDPAAGGSIWPLIAKLFMADQGVPVGFITTAYGGTTLITDWKSTTPLGDKYTNCLNRIAAAAPNGIKAMIWDQGEYDARDGVSRSEYNAALDALIINMQAASGLTFPMVCDLVGYMSPAGTLDEIRQAQIEAWEDNAYIYPGANSLTRAGLHWTTNANAAMHAGLLWIAMDEAFYGGPSGRGPRLVSAVTTSGSSTLTLTFDRDLLTSDSTYTSTAFEVSHIGAARTVSSATRTGTRTVDLVLSGPLNGSLPTVTLGSDLTAAGATVPRSTAITLPISINSIASFSIPAEPIYESSVTVSGSFAAAVLSGPKQRYNANRFGSNRFAAGKYQGGGTNTPDFMYGVLDITPTIDGEISVKSSLVGDAKVFLSLRGKIEINK